MWGREAILLGLTLALVEGACKTADAKWKSQGVPKVTPVSSSRPERVLVDWRTIINHPECADSFDIWVWKEGQEKKQGKKTSLIGSQALSKEVTVEPCVFYNIGVDIHEKDWINTHLRESAVAKYNSAKLPSLNASDVLPYFTVGYHKDPSSGQYDLTKASIGIKTSFITFASCIKHLEVTGKQIAGARLASSGLATAETPTASPTTTGDGGVQTRFGEWEPYGSGRLPQGRGRPASRRWGSEGGWHGNPRTEEQRSGSYPWSPQQSTTTTTTSRPPAHSPGWAYPTHRPPSGRGGQGYNPGSSSGGGGGYHPGGSSRPDAHSGHRPDVWTRSAFTNQYVRMLRPASAQVAGPERATPPFAAQIEMVVKVEPCKEYEFELKIVTPAGGELAKITDLKLPPLPDIMTYVPPPFTKVVKIGLLGGKLSLSTQPSSPVPAACLPRYLEAVDAFAERMEAAANSQEGNTRAVEREMGKAQDLVEITQEKILAKKGCVCSSPRLQLGEKIFLYQGEREGHPYYREDLEGRSLPSDNPSSTPLIRSKREAFIGRVDGGGSTTTRRPWNYGSHGGSSGWTRPAGGARSGSRAGSSSSSRSSLGSRSSSSRPSLTGGPNTLGQRGGLLGSTRPAAPVASFLYWEPKAKQWLVAPELGSPASGATMASVAPSAGLCPADTALEWQSPGSRTRSGLTRNWSPMAGTTLQCKPDIGA